MKIRIATSSRLHLGFMDLNGSLGRLFGSMGVSLSQPVTEISVKKHRHLSVENVGKDKKRKILDLVGAFSDHYQIDAKIIISVHKSIPEHKGLGSGTQLALAITTALAQLYGIKADSRELSQISGRGTRSGIGIHGFEHGGLIVDSGKKILESGTTEANSPKALVRYDFPEEWQFVVVIPKEKQGLSGEQEKKAISFVHPSEKISEEICRLIIMKLLPALVERDIKEFGSALSDIDRKTGLFFEPIQGGIYSEKRSQKLIDHLLFSGAYGGGQSSWGPAVYGLTLKEESADVADRMKAFLKQHEIEGKVLICSGRNRGADIVRMVEADRTTSRKPLDWQCSQQVCKA